MASTDSAAAATSNKSCKMCDKLGLKPFTKENILYYYIPFHGVISYAAQSINVMNPSMVSKVMPKKDMTNVLLVSSLVGSAFYIYGRPHLSNVSKKKRATYAVLGGSLFSMGSVLAWALIKSILPKDSPAAATLIGLASGAVIVKLSTDYFADCDKLAVSKN